MESKLKIAYIYYMLRENQTGVELKAKRQAKAAIDAGLNLDIFFLNPWQEGKIDYVNYIKLPQHISPIKYFNYFFRRYHLIENCLDLSSYDYLILRYPLADKTGLAFTKKYRVVTEHHTKELVELRSQLNTAAKTPFYERVARRIILLMEERYGTAVLQNCQGIVTVTNSLRQYQEKRIEQSKLPTIAIGNGVDTIGTELTEFKPFNGKQLNLVFLIGRLQPWQGLERIIESLNSYQGNVDIQLHVLGNVDADEIKTLNLEKVKFYGSKIGKELDQILSEMTLGVSTLTLHKKNMVEASSLKTGEYTARGLPFILANDDIGLTSVPPDKRFFLQFDNNDSLLDMQKTINFAIDMTARREEIIPYMREYALTKLDWRIKLQQYVDFVHLIDKQHQNGRLST